MENFKELWSSIPQTWLNIALERSIDVSILWQRKNVIRRRNFFLLYLLFMMYC